VLDAPSPPSQPYAFKLVQTPTYSFDDLSQDVSPWCKSIYLNVVFSTEIYIKINRFKSIHFNKKKCTGGALVKIFWFTTGIYIVNNETFDLLWYEAYYLIFLNIIGCCRNTFLDSKGSPESWTPTIVVLKNYRHQLPTSNFLNINATYSKTSCSTSRHKKFKLDKLISHAWHILLLIYNTSLCSTVSNVRSRLFLILFFSSPLFLISF